MSIAEHVFSWATWLVAFVALIRTWQIGKDIAKLQRDVGNLRIRETRRQP